MSDFVSRMAARAVGAAPAARPRAASPFAGEPQGELVELVGEAPAAPTTAAADRHSPVAASSTSAATPGPGGPPSRPPSAGEAPPRRPAASERGRAATTPAVPAPAAPPRSDGPVAVVPAAPPPRDHEGALVSGAPPAPEAPAPTELVRVSAAVPATRSAPAAPPQAQVARSASSPAPEGGPAVRVHIGRLEVRANLRPEPTSAPRRPAAAEREEPALSLADYLRGAGGKG